MSIVERVKKLLKLTTSDNEHEASSAARQACRLILEHELEIVPKLGPGSFVPIVTPVQVRQRYPGVPLTREHKPARPNPFAPGTRQTPEELAEAARRLSKEIEERKAISEAARKKSKERKA